MYIAFILKLDKFVVLACFALLCLVVATIYVDPTASGDDSGTSWANAMPEVRDALAFVRCFPGQPMTVRVAQGTYLTAASGIDTPTFAFTPMLSLFGGYPLGGGIQDPAAYPTILSGELGSPGNSADNADYVVTASDVGTSVLDGFFIQDGYSVGNGSGLRIQGLTTFIMSRCIVRKNTGRYGGGLNSSYVTLLKAINCHFDSNVSHVSGGGVMVLFSTNIFTNCLFTQNVTADRGGALYIISHWDQLLVNCSFVDNESVNGTALYATPETTISNSIFWQTSDLGAVIGGTPTVEHSVTYGNVWPGINNFNLDPQFVDDCGVVDSGTGDGAIIDIGAYEKRPSVMESIPFGSQAQLIAWGDYDNDGDDDAYLSKTSAAANQLLRNDGNGFFVDVTPTNLAVANATEVSSWGDYDNDGDFDVAVTKTTPVEIYENDGAGNFTNVTPQIVTNLGPQFGSEWVDHDNDGTLDLVSFGLTGKVICLFGIDSNVSCSGNWLHVDLEGVVSNARGLGARIDVVAGGVTQSRWVSSSRGSHTAFFGVGDLSTVTVNVAWPSGQFQTQSNISTNQMILMNEVIGTSNVQLFVNDQAGWDAAINGGSSAITFLTTAANLAQADEISNPPGTNAALGTALTFASANTGLPVDFRLEAINIFPGDPSRALVFDDNEQGAPVGERVISIGDINGNGQAGSATFYEDDDFRLVFDPAGELPFAVGFTLNGNSTESGEYIEVYGPGGAVVAVFDLTEIVASPDWLPGTLIGLVSDEAITMVVFNEHPGPDDMGIRDFVFAVDGVSATPELKVVTAYALQAPAPNPFNPQTRIAFDLPTSGKVRLTVYDLQGRRIKTLVDEHMSAGQHNVTWMGRDHGGRPVSSGVYLYRMQAGDFVQTRRMMLVK